MSIEATELSATVSASSQTVYNMLITLLYSLHWCHIYSETFCIYCLHINMYPVVCICVATCLIQYLADSAQLIFLRLIYYCNQTYGFSLKRQATQYLRLIHYCNQTCGFSLERCAAQCEGMNSGVKLPCLNLGSSTHYLWPSTCYLTFLWFQFPICKLRKILPTAKDYSDK